VPSVTWFSLQQHRGPEETHPALTDISRDDLFEAARRVRALDLLITVDSMPAHLGGALGVPVWTLLVHDPDWRWMRDRDDSPWYPTMRLLRQPGPGDWEPVISAVVSRLRTIARPPGDSARSG
jgi:ADP-heptose:LPS heptosyltransferase